MDIETAQRHIQRENDRAAIIDANVASPAEIEYMTPQEFAAAAIRARCLNAPKSPS